MDKVSTQATYKEQIKVSLFSFISELPNFVAVAASALATGSLVMWVDFLSSGCNVIRTGFVSLLSKKLQSNLTYKYNYGIVRVEAMSALFTDAVMLMGILLMFTISTMQLINPEEPSKLLLYVIILKVINCLVDLFILLKQKKIKKGNDSKVVQTEFEAYVSALAFDASVLLAVVLSCVLRGSRISWYVNPVFSIAISAVCGIKAIRRIKEKIGQLTDVTLSEDYQFEILKVLNRHNNEYDRFLAVKSHKIGEKVCVDLELTFNGNEKYDDIRAFADAVSEELRKALGECEVSIIINEEK